MPPGTSALRLRVKATRQYWSLGSGDLSLDFANTRRNRLKLPKEESFFEIRDVLDWLRFRGSLDRASHQRWTARFRRSPRVARRLFARALGFREALYRMFWAVANRRHPLAADVRVLNDLLAIGVAAPKLAVHRDARFTLIYRGSGDPLAELLGPIASAAAVLLSQGDLRRLRRCLNRACGSAFFDRTKNNRRRWCHMRICGTAFKMRAYRARSRGRR